VKKLEPNWWMVFVSGEVYNQMDAGLFMQVRKEGTVWKALSVNERTGAGNES
jgi:hypothetical protein